MSQQQQVFVQCPICKASIMEQLFFQYHQYQCENNRRSNQPIVQQQPPNRISQPTLIQQQMRSLQGQQQTQLQQQVIFNPPPQMNQQVSYIGDLTEKKCEYCGEVFPNSFLDQHIASCTVKFQIEKLQEEEFAQNSMIYNQQQQHQDLQSSDEEVEQQSNIPEQSNFQQQNLGPLRPGIERRTEESLPNGGVRVVVERCDQYGNISRQEQTSYGGNSRQFMIQTSGNMPQQLIQSSGLNRNQIQQMQSNGIARNLDNSQEFVNPFQLMTQIMSPGFSSTQFSNSQSDRIQRILQTIGILSGQNPYERGLRQQEIDDLNTIKFKKSVNLSEENRSCTICITEFQDNEMIILLPCLHRFHRECIAQWLNQHNNCPICKQIIES